MSENSSILSSALSRENAFLRKVYLWMASALVLTGAVAYLVGTSESLIRVLYTNPVLIIALVVAELVMAIVLSARIEKLSQGAAIALFYGYSAINGLMLSSVVVCYARTNILPLSLGTTAAVFIIASLYGVFTKRSVKGWGGWLCMALIGLMIVSLVNMFLGSSSLDFLISICGVLIFTLLTAWDTKKVLEMNNSYGTMMDESELNKISILGALELYLDFINILMYLIRLYARVKKND